MASESRSRLSSGSDEAYRGSELSPDIRQLLERAPHFNALVKAVRGEMPELTPYQKEFLRDFANQLAICGAEIDDVSAPPVVRKPAKLAEPDTRHKDGQLRADRTSRSKSGKP